MSIEVVFQFIAYTVPVIMVLGGILLLVLGYTTNHIGMIRAGWSLILLGGGIYVLEIVLAYLSEQS